MNQRTSRGLIVNVLVAGSFVVLFLLAVVATGRAQRGQPAGLGDGPWTYGNGANRYRVVVVTKGLVKPWSMAFLPDGSILITELGGRLRIVRNGVLDPKPVAGVPEVYAVRLDGLMDLALHPNFAANRLVYIAYSKVGPDLAAGAERLSARLPANLTQRDARGRTTTNAIWRARWDGTALVEGKDIFVSDNWMDDSISQTSASRLVFGRDGMLYLGLGAPNAPATSGKYARSRGGRAQDPNNHGGKFLRLKDDGTVPRDNPFVGKPATNRKSLRWGTATCWVWLSIRSRARSGKTRMDRRTATRSTSSRPD